MNPGHSSVELTRRGRRAATPKTSKPAYRRHPPHDVEQRLLDVWIRWQDEVLRPRVQRLLERSTRDSDPAWSSGDELGLLKEHHENDFSNWLKWLLTAPGPVGTILQEALLAALWPDAAPHPRFASERERSVRKGHVGHRGRLDLVLESRASLRALIVEAKVRAPSQKELKKQGGYLTSVREEHPDWLCHFVLLLPEQDSVRGMDTYGFTPVSWRTVSLALRRLLHARTLSVEPRTEALVAVAASAIEGNLLHYPLNSWRQALSGTPLGRATLQTLAASPLLAYLEEAHGL